MSSRVTVIQRLNGAEGSASKKVYSQTVSERPQFLTTQMSPEGCLSVLTIWHLASSRQQFRAGRKPQCFLQSAFRSHTLSLLQLSIHQSESLHPHNQGEQNWTLHLEKGVVENLQTCFKSLTFVGTLGRSQRQLPYLKWVTNKDLLCSPMLSGLCSMA